MNDISCGLTSALDRIKRASERKERLVESVKLLAVSKTKPVSAIEKAYQLGQRDFGENYLQEAVDKIKVIIEKDIVWHYIGAIQSNKTKPIAENFDWVHGVCELKHARRLSDQRPADLSSLNICLQVNINCEANKSGILPDMETVLNFVKEVVTLENVSLRGLMVIPSADNDDVQMREAFCQTREIFESIKKSKLVDEGFDTLSMGMSGDLELAIAEGSTMVRVGTAIFGKRDYT